MLEELEPLTPVNFFAISSDCHHYSGRKEIPLPKKYLLPDLSELTGDTTFAEISLGWSQKGLFATIIINKTTLQPFFPDFTAGDSVEFFIDTRDVKTSSFNTRFCHHFFFLPLPISTNGEMIQAGEITRFRTEDAHELCNPTLLKVTCGQEKRKTVMQLFIPSEALVGYDPSQFARIGFTYRINRYDEPPQHFSASSEDFAIEQNPQSWATLQLLKDYTNDEK